MKRQAQNQFNNGMIKDLTPLSTPRDVLTDCLNGTIITYNGNEFVLQNDMGNCQVDNAKLSPGFIPLGMKEYGGIVYVASLNPETNMCEIGSFPSPQEDFSTTDYGNIGPANFLNTDFTVDSGNDSVSLRTVKNLKLFEPEVMQLHPGDMYVVLYTITPPSPDIPGNEIKDNTTYNEFVSNDPTNRKLFRLTFSIINANNNLTTLAPGDIKVIPYQADVSDQYVYFKEPSQATIAVGLELEQLDAFDASVVDASLNTDSDKKVSIQAYGKGASLSNFQGVRVEVTSPSTETFYLEPQTGNTVEAIVDGLSQNDNFKCALTPYSQYCLFPNLTKNFNLVMGQYLTAGSGVNNLFAYYLDSTFIKIDFDYKFQGNSQNGIHLYVELYDPWSDYSILKTVDNPTYYGLNTVIFNTVNEPLVDEFDSTTVGGTSPSALIDNPDTEFEKTILCSTNKIRVDQSVRLNTFYIVRISGVDQSYDAQTVTFTYQHYDFYKGMYTTDMFNDVYTKQATLSVNDPAYVTDFNELDFDLSKISYQTTVSQSFLNVLPPTSVNYPNTTTTDPITGQPIVTYPLMTGTNWYHVDDGTYSGSTTYKNSSVYETDVEYNVSLELQGTNYVFGNFKTNMLSITMPTLLASNDTSGDPGTKPTIVEQTISGTPATNSVATWSSTSLGDNNYNINISATTTRNVQANAQIDNKTGINYSEVSLAQSFHAFPDNTGPLTNTKATIELSQGNFPGDPNNNFKWVDSTGTVHTVYILGADDGDLYNAFQGLTRKYSAFWGSMYNRCNFWWWPGAPGDYGDVHNAQCADRYDVLMFRNESLGTISAVRVHDINVAIDMFNTLKVASNVSKTLYLYSPNVSTVTKNGQLQTTFKFAAAITTNFTPDTSGGSPIKTYLSNFRFRALNTIDEFNPTVINNYIQSCIGDSIIVDNKQTIRDGFIPYINATEQTTYPLQFDDIVINQAASSDALTAMLNGTTVGNQDPAFVSLGNYKPHGTLFSSDSSKYADMASIFKVGGFTTGVDIDPSKVYIYLNSSRPMWTGYYRIGGSPHFKNAPDLHQEFQYS